MSTISSVIPQELTTLYRELLIGVTSFFRDQEAFDFLATNVLPDLFRNATSREIRFWVAACSTGEEAYSLAILARECLEKLGSSHDIKIFATDIDQTRFILPLPAAIPRVLPLTCRPGFWQNISTNVTTTSRLPAPSAKWWSLPSNNLICA